MKLYICAPVLNRRPGDVIEVTKDEGEAILADYEGYVVKIVEKISKGDVQGVAANPESKAEDADS